MSEPRFYEIRVKGHLGISWLTWFEGLTIRHEGNEQTALAGMMDQAALHGALASIRDLGLPLLSVNRVVPTRREDDDENTSNHW